jgi:rhamnose transport system ATP-binding protein
MNENLLELKGITKRFSGVEVLHQVSFSLKSGEVHALLGENGAGKSTLVKVITGVHQPDGGEILLSGVQTVFSDTRESRQAGIAAIYQELSLFPDLSVAENIFIGRQPTTVGGRIDWRKLYAEADKLLASLGVHLELKRKARSLSIAQQQMVEIARAISIKARILIMDEPTSSLTLNEVTVLRDGAYVDTRQIRDVTRDDLIRMMVGRTITNMYPKQDIKAGRVVLKVDHLTREGAFRDISFELREGEILGMAGLVGAGRTNVARAIFGVEPPTSGLIQLDGRVIHMTSSQQAIALGLAYVPEDRQLHGLISRMNITANISLPMLQDYARLGWLQEQAERSSAFNAARQIEVRANNIWQKALELSGGNQQKVVLAKWLSTNPKILILDEPTRGIDVGTKAAVHALMGKLAAEGIAILMISSELPEVLGMSDRIIVMHEGRMTGHFSRAEATQEKIISAATQAVTTGSVS